MKLRQFTIAALILAVVGLVGISINAHAGRGGGQGANCPMGGFGPGGGNLTDEEIATVQKERNAFIESTRDLRDRHYQKSLELRAEMAKQNPDAAKVMALQKEVSAMEGDLDAKRIEQQLKMKKDYPQIYSKGFGHGMGMGGHGMGMGGRGMGMGPGGGMGPGVGMGPGYGRGPGGAPCCQ